jgi:hypothetical protein
MCLPRSIFPLVAAALVLALSAAPAAADGTPPVVRTTGSVTPGKLPIPKGTPLTLAIDTVVTHDPLSPPFVLERVDHLFGHGASLNASRFPSCSAAKLDAAHGDMRVCPKGSLIGTGSASGTAVGFGYTGTGRLFVFNGPGGRSLTIHFKLVHPALIKASISAPFIRQQGRWFIKLSAVIPPELRQVLDSDIIVRRIAVKVGATRVVAGKRVGYLEATECPAGGSAIHLDFMFSGGVTSSADDTLFPSC